MSQTETLISRHPLKRAKIIKKTITSVFMLAFLVLMFVAVFGAFLPIWLTIGGAAVLLFLSVGIAFAYQTLYFNNYFYDLSADGLVVSKGVLGRWKITVPPNKVQDVYLDQDIFDRIFGLYDLHLSTATDVSQREAHIDGVGKDDAQALRSILLQWLEGKNGKVAEIMPVGAPAGGEVVKSIPLASAGLVMSAFYNMFLFALVLVFLFLPLVILAPIGAVLAYLEFNFRRYELRKDGVYIRTSFITPKENLFLYRNIQDIEINQTLVERLLGISTLVVKTMTGESAVFARLPYISGEDAADAREYVLAQSRRAAAEAQAAAQPVKMVAGRPTKAKMKLQAAAEILGPALVKPFKLNFFRWAKYNYLFDIAVGLIVFIAAVIAAVAAIGFGAPAGATLLLLGGIGAVIAILVLGGMLGIFIDALIKDMSYSYSVASDALSVSIRFFSTTERRIPFVKVQDIEKHISFTNSFAGLADIALESGAKEAISGSEGRQGGSRSGTVANEKIPTLLNEDAEQLKLMFAERMGISLQGLGKNPLISRLPLSTRKPLKKTIYFAVLPIIIFAIFLAFGIYLNSPLMYGVVVAAGIIAAVAIGAKYWYECQYLKKYFYDLNDDVLLIRKGVFGSRELTIQFAKIQEVFINRDILDLVFGLYDVYVSTATGRSILNAHLDGLEHDNAEKAALLIIEKIAASK